MPGTLSRAFGGLYSILVYRVLVPLFGGLYRLHRPLVRPGHRVLDIGAHRGTRTEVYRRLGAEVVAVEADPDLVRVLQRRFRGLPEVVVCHGAVTSPEQAASGVVSLHRLAANPSLNSIRDGWTQRLGVSGTAEQIDVPALSVADLESRYGPADFIKVDVEGAELAVLAGIRRAPRLISLEVLPPTVDELPRMLEALHSLGLTEFNFTRGEQNRFRFKSWLSKTEALRHLPHEIMRGGGDLYAQKPGSSSG